MQNNVFVSVILPTYNREKQLPGAVESVLKQTHGALELIIVDDASTDGTADYINTLEDKRVRYIRLEQNMGAAAARNIGINSAGYDLIAFEDSDDFWRPEKLEKQIAVMDEQTGMVYCAYAIEDEFRRRICIPSRLCDRTALSGDIYNRLREGNIVGTPTVLVRKDCLIKIGGFSEKMRSIEDWELALRVAKITQIKYIDEILVDASLSLASVNRHLGNRINSELYMLTEYGKEEVLKDTVVRYMLDDTQSLNHDREIEYWKERIQRELENTGDYFDLLWCTNMMKKRYEVCNRILRAMCSDECVRKFIRDRICAKDKIAVYGLGVLGMAWLDKMEDLSIDVECVADKNVFSYKNFSIVMQMKELSRCNISKMIITIPEQYQAIVRELNGYIKCEYINIADILAI
ncbi:glycosyltransferase family 2 protein [Lachnospiraceae bacterium 62-26]